MAKKHRGRIQAQGGGLEKSESWAQDEPLSKEDGLNLLQRLWEQLTRKEQEERKAPFEKAKRYIENVQDGADAPERRNFYNNRKLKEGIRVDIEVWAGTAFSILLLLYLLL